MVRAEARELPQLSPVTRILGLHRSSFPQEPHPTLTLTLILTLALTPVPT
jgi:hypothetical protein